MTTLGALVREGEQRALLQSILPGGNHWRAFEMRGGHCLKSCPHWNACESGGPQKKLCSEKWHEATDSPAALRVLCHVLGNFSHYDRGDCGDAEAGKSAHALRTFFSERLNEELEHAREEAVRRSALKAPEKAELIKARRGQGLFRSRVLEVEGGRCRVTGVAALDHLRASHIKPWAASSAKECLDGDNGLLLAPHLSHLFERGYIGFSGAGYLLVAKDLDRRVINAWRIQPDLYVGKFSARQKQYLAYHRRNVFEKKYRGA